MVLLVLQVGVLLRMAWEDWRSRTLYAFWFPVILMLLLANHNASQWVRWDVSINIGILIVQCILIMMYLRLKTGTWVKLTNGFIGWGDLCMLLVLSINFSTPAFIIFQLASIVSLLLIYSIVSVIFKRETQTLPLAGHQALCLMILLVTGQLYKESDFFATYARFLNHIQL